MINEFFYPFSASAQPSPGPVPKLLYSDGHIIAEGFDLYLQYQLYIDKESNKKYLSFNIAHGSYMILHQSATDSLENGVAMEIFPNNGQRDDKLCRQKSSQNLRNLIESCWANIALRELTQAEKEQLKKFKDEKKGNELNSSSDPMSDWWVINDFWFNDEQMIRIKVKVLQLRDYFRFLIGMRSYQLVYNQKKITAQFTGIDYFQLWDKLSDSKNDFAVNINSLTENKSEMKLVGELAKRSFIVENQPAGSQRDCKETDLDLKPISCYGDIQIRKLNSDH